MLKRRKRTQEQIEKINKKRELRNKLFTKIWNIRPKKSKNIHLSEISNNEIYGDISTLYFHHILPKHKFPDAEFDEENIILITAQEHEQVELNPFRYEEINKRREKLKIKYNL